MKSKVQSPKSKVFCLLFLGRSLFKVDSSTNRKNFGLWTLDFGQRGYTLFELIITLTVLAILVVGTVPLAQNAVKRQNELRLRETLRDVREAIDEFRRDSIGACPQGAITTTNRTRQVFQAGTNVSSDPRSRVVIDDCTIF